MPRLTIALPPDGGPVTPFSDSPDPGIVDLAYDKLPSPSPYVDSPQPWLAEEVRHVDPSTWEVRIRPGVTWQDGQPLTAADVVFTFQYFRKVPSGRWTHHVGEVPDVETVEEVGDRTVRFRWGLGIVHKWSFLPHDVGRRANAITQGFR